LFTLLLGETPGASLCQRNFFGAKGLKTRERHFSTAQGNTVKSRWLALTFLAVLGSIGLAGCDDHVVIDRDASIPIHKGMTWAWRPAGPPPASKRPVSSRDTFNRRPPNYGPNAGPTYDNVPPYQRNSYWENDIVRNRIARAFEQELNHRGLVQVSDPANADFLVDYQFAVQPRRERVATPVYSSGLVCGYYGCWNGFYGPPGYYVHTIQYREGTIVFDLVDHGINRLAYRAIRENVVHRDSFTDDEVREGVKHLLKGLKPN
jgi:hypothetical protein